MNGATRLLAVLLVASLTVLAGCGDSTGGGAGKLSADDVAPALRGLPFGAHVRAVKAPAGDDAAFLGTAERAGVVVRFSIGLGESPVPVPIPGVGAERVLGEGGFGFSFTTDAFYLSAFRSTAEYRKAVHTAAEISEQLCKKVSGKPCPV
jgi:hypothetical protein